MSHACHRFWKCYKALTFCSLLTRFTVPCVCHAKRHLNVQKPRTCGVFNVLTSKCASRHNGVHFFDIATSKSAPMLRCFAHVDLEMCFAPQRRALFPHLNFQKRSEREVLLAFSLANVLPATTANLVCFVRFDFEMCLAPHQRAIFHLSSAQRAPHPPL